MLFTSRNKAAEGLEPQIITNHLVGSLPEKEATRVLRSNSVDLKGQELQQALKFCAGLPLALRLLNGALRGVLPSRGRLRFYHAAAG